MDYLSDFSTMRKCPTCQKPLPKNAHSTQVYCDSKCREKGYNSGHRCIAEKGKPLWRCQKCSYETQLDFDPREDIAQWRNWGCPKCGKPNIK